MFIVVLLAPTVTPSIKYSLVPSWNIISNFSAPTKYSPTSLLLTSNLANFTHWTVELPLILSLAIQASPATGLFLLFKKASLVTVPSTWELNEKKRGL